MGCDRDHACRIFHCDGCVALSAIGPIGKLTVSIVAPGLDGSVPIQRKTVLTPCGHFDEIGRFATSAGVSASSLVLATPLPS